MSLRYTTFTPPAVPNGASVLGHVSSTRRALQSWFLAEGSVKFVELVMPRELLEELAHQAEMISPSAGGTPSSLYGIPLVESHAFYDPRVYVVGYEVIS